MIALVALCIIFGCLSIGELVVYLTHIPIPASIIGMAVLFILLKTKSVKPTWIQPVSDFFMQNIALFLIPPCVSVIQHFDIIRHDFWIIFIATILSTILVIISTGKFYEFIRKHL